MSRQQITEIFNKSNIFRPYMVSSGPGSKGLLQYVVLKEGHWVEQSDKDMIDI